MRTDRSMSVRFIEVVQLRNRPIDRAALTIDDRIPKLLKHPYIAEHTLMFPKTDQ